MKRILLLSLFPLSASAATLTSDPVDPRATHCGVFQDNILIASSPVVAATGGNICSYTLTPELSPTGAHLYQVNAQVYVGNVKTAESAKSNTVRYVVKPSAPTNLKVQ